MKKLLLASAVAALSVSAANAAPTVYGKAFLTADYVDIDSLSVDEDTDEVQLNSNSSRLGVKGSEAITANTDVIYQLEYGVDIDGDDSKTLSARDTFLGLKNNAAGEFRFGRNQSSLDRVNNVVTAYNGYWDNLGNADNMVDSGRIDNSLLWLSPSMSGFQAAAMVATEEKEEADAGYGLSLMFDQGTGFTAGVSYDKDLNLGHNYETSSGDIIRGTLTADLAKLGGGLPLTVGALYQQADIDGAAKKEKGYVISAEMGLQNFAKPAAVYAQYNNTSNLRGFNGVDSDQIVVGGKYFYKQNVIAHAYVGQNDSDRNDTETFALGGGIEYKF